MLIKKLQYGLIILINIYDIYVNISQLYRNSTKSFSRHVLYPYLDSGLVAQETGKR